MSLPQNDFLELFEKNEPEEIFDEYLDKMSMRDMQILYLKNPKFKQVFLNKFKQVIEITDEIIYWHISSIFQDPRGKKVIIENLPQVLKKMVNRDVFLSYWPKDKETMKENIDAFFVESYKTSENDKENNVAYNNILNLLCDYYENDEILQLIDKHIYNIINDGNNFSEIMIKINKYINDSKLPQKRLREIIKRIDQALVENIDKILEKKDEEGYTLSSFMHMESFLKEIKNRGIDVFRKFHLRKSKEINVRKDICQQLFGKYDEEYFAIMQFGRLDKTLVKAIEIITRELISKSQGNFTAKDIEIAGEGRI